MSHARVRLYRTITPEGVVVVTADGEIDHNAAALLHRALIPPAGHPPRVVLELTRTSFMDCAGANALIRAHHTLRNAGGWLRLSCAQPPVTDVIHILGLHTVIPLHPTTHHALHTRA
ncbi:hypothetical protein GCM10027168_10170 [Streptomyces capparidis]